MKIKMLFLSVLAFSFCAVSFGQTIPAAAQPESVYLVGPGDVVEGKVLGETDFNFIATVDERGEIEVPFFDEPVSVKCRSERDLRQDVVKLLSKYLRNPLVNIEVKRNRPPATVYGEVRTPQQVVLTRKSTLLELISFSGGVTEEAGGMIQVFRTQSPMCSDNTEDSDWVAKNGMAEVPSRIYSLSSLKKGLDEANPIIYPGDVIVVQRAAPVYIVGEVRQPTGLLLKEGGLSLSRAMAMVGGVNREAKTKDIKIRRTKPNSKEIEIISINYNAIQKDGKNDVMLEPYDIVEVDKAKKSIPQIVGEIALGIGKQIPSTFGTALPQRILY